MDIQGRALPTLLKIRGARVHNLKSVNLDIPLRSLVVITGPAGSGKSSLAFETIAAVGEARLARLTSRTDSMVEQLPQPEVDCIEGLPLVLACKPEPPDWGPYSTAATAMGLAEELASYFLRCCVLGGTGAREQSASLLCFRSAAGRCMHCGGLGERAALSISALVPREELSLEEGAIAYWHDKNPNYYGGLLRAFCLEAGIDVTAPWSTLSPAARELLLHGQGESDFRGVVFDLERRLANAGQPAPEVGDTLESLRPYLEMTPCQSCSGSRWSEEARALRVAGLSIADVHRASLRDLPAIIEQLAKAAGSQAETLHSLRESIAGRLDVASDLSLDHLSLDFSASELGAEESKRLRVALLLSGGLHDLLFVLHEPSAGLDPAGTQRILALLRRCIEDGNSVLLVSTDPVVVKEADTVIALGPPAD